MADSKIYKKPILVAGGAGFIGSHLCDALIKRGNSVICVDDLQTGSLDNVNHLFQYDNFEFIYHNIINFINLNVSQIYNLACPASPKRYQEHPIETTKTNVLGALNLLELARQLNVPILQASTSEIYGDPTIHPQTEDYQGNVNPIGIRSCYDEGKRCAESLFFDYYRVHDLRIRVARIFNTYGPRMQKDDGRVVSNFIVQAMQDKNLTVYGDGKQTRSLCYIDDLINSLIMLMNLKNHDGSYKIVNTPVNLGNPYEISVNSLAKLIIDLSKSNSKIINLDLPLDDPKKRKPDISLAQQFLTGWEPITDLRQGLIKTISYFKKIPKL